MTIFCKSAQKLLFTISTMMKNSNNNKRKAADSNLPLPSSKLTRKQRRNKRIEDMKTYSEKGFSHAYKSKNECSKRTQHAKAVLNKAGTRIQDIVVGVSKTIAIFEEDNEMFMAYINREMEKNGKSKAVFSGKIDSKNDTHVSDQCENAHVFGIQNNKNIRIVNNDDGGVSCINRSSGQIVFILLPRKEVKFLCKGKNKKMTVDNMRLSLEAISDCKVANSGVRGSKREIIFEGDARKNYVNVGVAADRGGKGLKYKMPKKFEGTERHYFLKKWMCKVSNVVEKYLPTRILSGLRKAADDVSFKGFAVSGVPIKGSGKLGEGNTTGNHPRMCLFPTLALSKSVALTMHDDEDMFFSVAAVYHDKDWDSGTKQLDENCEVLKYFTFGCGISVAMRTGDLLVFNPQEQHCISTNTEAVGEKGVFTTSHYCKTNLFGLNDNDIVFAKKEEDG